MTTNQQAVPYKLCFYGAGSMAEAIARGLIARGLAEPAHISMLNRSNQPRLNELHERYGVTVPFSDTDRSLLIQEADIIFLCMKPKDAAAAIRSISGLLRENQLLVSVIAGLSTSTIAALAGKPLPIVRTMPNTSSTIGLGATGISFTSGVSAKQREQIAAMFGAIGSVAVVEEEQINAVTAVSGSGPAYIYYFMDAMMEAGAKLGLSPEAAKELTVQTVLGAAMMVKETGEQPSELRRKVTSPGGTTQAAIETMQASLVSESIVKAMNRAAERATEMGAELERSVTLS